MKQQERDFNKRIEQWAAANGFKFNGANENVVNLERLSDGYPFEANARLLDQIMRDEGY